MQHEVDSESVRLHISRDSGVAECGDLLVSDAYDVDRIGVGTEPRSIGDGGKTGIAVAVGWIVGHTVTR